MAAPVPAPVDLAPEVDHQAFTPPSAKPVADPQESMQHSGSFADIPVAARVAVPRVRVEVPLPHWPFADDLDLVGQIPDDALATASDFPSFKPSAAPVGSSPVEPVEPDPLVEAQPIPELPRLAFPVQVAQAQPAAEAVPVVEAPAPTPVAPVDTPVPQPTPPPDAAMAGTLSPEADPLQQLKPIRNIQPFYDYLPNGGDPHDTLCPLPANADPNKTYKHCPTESPLVAQGSLDRNGTIIPVYWQASNVSHNPLYFEDSGLERSGHAFSDVVQPFISVGRFGAQVVALPYSIALDPVWKRETPLGHYRPGECAPKRHLAVPLNGRAAVVAAAAYTGIIFLIP